MATALKEKVKELETRLATIELFSPFGKKAAVPFRVAVRSIYGMWKKKPRTQKDLDRLRNRMWR